MRESEVVGRVGWLEGLANFEGQGEVHEIGLHEAGDGVADVIDLREFD